MLEPRLASLALCTSPSVLRVLIKPAALNSSSSPPPGIGAFGTIGDGGEDKNNSGAEGRGCTCGKTLVVVVDGTHGGSFGERFVGLNVMLWDGGVVWELSWGVI